MALTAVRVGTNPSAATLTDAYTITAGATFEGVVNAANRSATPTSIRVAIAPLGAADALTHYIAYDLPIGANVVIVSYRFTARATDVIRVYATLATVTFMVSGLERS